MKKIVSIGFIVAVMCLLTGQVYAATSTIYNNGLTNPLPGNVPSMGPEAYAFKELGGQVSFDGVARVNPKVTVMMSSWACQSGHWYSSDCVTAPGATYSHPVTLTLYAVNPDNSPGTVLSTKTQSFDMPYRPSTDSTNCTSGRWFDGSNCFNGKAFPITFDFAGVTLPDKVIIGVSYNSTHYGYSPIGEAAACYTGSAGCFYDSLNIGLGYPPSVGSAPLPNDIYQNSVSGGMYCDGGTAGVGTFRLDAGCWTGYQPTIKVDAEEPVKELVGKATGGLNLKEPKQHISFNVFDYGNSNFDEGNVEYQNFEYAGGLHYTAKVMCANVKKSSGESWFMFQIPEGFPGLTGLYVVSYVKDVSTPGAKGDIYGHSATGDLATAKSWCENGTAPVSTYAISGGNAVVHK